MEKKYQLKKQDLLDKLAELAATLSAGRRIDPNSMQVKMQLEAIQVELESLQRKPFSQQDFADRQQNGA
ncbi:hypothetical protein [Sediminibacterium soli]|uniref:hypothetical protein n=1 Tax=Sediminibacterium soli TaxID=2698829 RepID=UPI00137A0EA0|nr:hypothetical protein [Sediminibacterium soli]NCI45632.1 hypothetical protein [Sediminibacterium soli]